MSRRQKRFFDRDSGLSGTFRYPGKCSCISGTNLLKKTRFVVRDSGLPGTRRKMLLHFRRTFVLRDSAIQAPAENCSCIFGIHAVPGDKKAGLDCS